MLKELFHYLIQLHLHTHTISTETLETLVGTADC